MADQDQTPEAAEVPEEVPTIETEAGQIDAEIVAEVVDSTEGSVAVDAPDTVEVDLTEGVEPDDLMTKRIMELESEIDKNRQGWQRTLAEFQNYKRRIEREQQGIQQKAVFQIIGQILPIVDDFERALANAPEDLQGNPWLNGVSLIQGKFKKLMDEYDVAVIDPVGEPFDPNRHQAISMDDSHEVESGHVIETLQKGYESGDNILRPALVRVAN